MGRVGREGGISADTCPPSSSQPHPSPALPRPPACRAAGEARPPLTVVLVNNAGGGIFSFLPIAEALPEDVFTPLWATPQHVDLEGACRAALRCAVCAVHALCAGLGCRSRLVPPSISIQQHPF